MKTVQATIYLDSSGEQHLTVEAAFKSEVRIKLAAIWPEAPGTSRFDISNNIIASVLTNPQILPILKFIIDETYATTPATSSTH